MSEDNACPFCGGKASLFLQATDVNRRVSDLVFQLLRCEACGLLSLGNPPADLGRYYTAGYHPKASTVADLEPQLRPHRYKLDLVRRYHAGGRLLEIGPSMGAFCLLAQRAGFEVEAIEIDPGCVAFLRDQLGIRTHHSGDPDLVLAQAEDETYDVICLWHALEHVPRPWAVLDAAARRLRPGGCVVIACPNPDSWQARVMGPRWPHWDLPRHLFAIPIAWLRRRAAALGLTVALETTKDQGSLHLNLIGWAMFFQHWPLPMRVLGRTLVPLLARPWDRIEGRGSCYVVVLRRPDEGAHAQT